MVDKIEQLRIQAKLKKRELALRAGVSEAQYYRYVNGATLSIQSAEKLIKALGYKLSIIIEV